MKKLLIVVFLLLLPGISMAGDLCFDMQCPDCNSTYTPQYLRVIDVISPTNFSGYIQAYDNSWGAPTYIIFKGNNLLFSRKSGSVSEKIYSYDVDLATWNGLSLSGVRHSVIYHKKRGIPYSLRDDNQLTLQVVACP